MNFTTPRITWWWSMTKYIQITPKNETYTGSFHWVKIKDNKLIKIKIKMAPMTLIFNGYKS